MAFECCFAPSVEPQSDCVVRREITCPLVEVDHGTTPTRLASSMQSLRRHCTSLTYSRRAYLPTDVLSRISDLQEQPSWPNAIPDDVCDCG